MGSNLLGSINHSDIFIMLIIITAVHTNFNLGHLFKDKQFKYYVNALSVFILYFYFIYGGIVPILHDDLNYPQFLLKTRNMIWGIVILFTSYHFALRGLYKFYKTTLIIGVICLSLYWITLATGFELIPVINIERYRGTGITRLVMGGYGYFSILFPLALFSYLLSRKLRFRMIHRKWLYYAGIAMLMTLLVTLTRRVFLDIFFTLIIASLLLRYLYKLKFLTGMYKYIIPLFLVFFSIQFVLPRYTGFIRNIGLDVYSLITTQKDTRGVQDYRLSGINELELVRKEIFDNLILGTGYSRLYWGDTGYATSSRGDKYALLADAASEVPIYYLFFGFGLIGAILILWIYYLVTKKSHELLKLIKTNRMLYLNDPVHLIFALYTILWIIGKVTHEAYTLSRDFRPSSFGGFMLLCALVFVLAYKFKLAEQTSKSINL